VLPELPEDASDVISAGLQALSIAVLNTPHAGVGPVVPPLLQQVCREITRLPELGNDSSCGVIRANNTRKESPVLAWQAVAGLWPGCPSRVSS
jgi:hypothetical protein